MSWNRYLGAILAVPMIGGIALTPAAASASHVARSAGVTSVRIYMIAVGDNGKSGKKVGCGDSLVDLTKAIAPTRAPLTAAVRMAVGDHRQFYGRSGLYNALYQSRLQLDRATVVNGTARVHLTGQLRQGGVCDAPRIRAQLRHAALQFPTVQRVFVYVNGVLLSQALSSK